MLPKNAKLTYIDPKIRKLVIVMNEVPFVDTISSCSGHFDKRYHSSRATSILKNYFLWDGWLSFQVDERYRLVSEFIERIEEQIKPYPFSRLEQHQISLYSDYPLIPPADVDELVDPLTQRLEDFGRYSSHYFSIVVTGKDLSFGNVEKAKARLKQFYELWRKITDICIEIKQRKDVASMLP